MDGCELGEPQLVNAVEERMIDILPTPDLPFPGQPSEHTSDQDTDAIFNLTLSPLPFFSTALPSPPTELIQTNAAAKRPESLLTPSPSSEDDMAHCFRPTDLDIMNSIYNSPTTLSDDPFVTPAANLPSPNSSTSIPTPSSNQNQPCHCLAASVFAVEEFEARCTSGNRAELDSILACQKEATTCCRSMLQCSSCMAKRENLVLLVFVTERMVAACSRVVALYRRQDGDDRVGLLPSSLLESVPDSNAIHAPHRDILPPSSSASSCATDAILPSADPASPSDWRELRLGDYEIDSRTEWEQLVRVLISVRLRAVRDLVADMQNVGRGVLREMYMKCLGVVRRRVCELERDICMGDCFLSRLDANSS